MVELKVNHFIFCISYNFVQGYELVPENSPGPGLPGQCGRSKELDVDNLKDLKREVNENGRPKKVKTGLCSHIKWMIPRVNTGSAAFDRSRRPDEKP